MNMVTIPNTTILAWATERNGPIGIGFSSAVVAFRKGYLRNKWELPVTRYVANDPDSPAIISEINTWQFDRTIMVVAISWDVQKQELLQSTLGIRINGFEEIISFDDEVSSVMGLS